MYNSPIIWSAVSAIISILLTCLIDRRKYKAEVEKIIAESEKIKTETEQLKNEAGEKQSESPRNDKIFKIDRDIQGETGIDDIKSANHSIHVTHFSGRTPQNDYIKAMTDKIDSDSIDTTRIIPNDLRNREWLGGFKKLGNKYTEKEVEIKLHFDMLIRQKKSASLFPRKQRRSRI